MILAQMRREFALRSLLWWIPIAMLMGTWIWGICIRLPNGLGPVPLADSSINLCVPLFTVWMAISIYLLNAGFAMRCTSPLDMAMPIATRSMWLTHVIAIILSGWSIIAVLAGMVAAGNAIMGRWPLLESGVISTGMHTAVCMVLALAVLQSPDPSLHDIPPRKGYIILMIVTMLGSLGLIFLLCALPRSYALIPLVAAAALFYRVYAAIPAALSLVPFAAEQRENPVEEKPAGHPHPTRCKSFRWLLLSTIWRSSIGKWTWAFLPVIMIHGMALALGVRAGENEWSRIFFCYLFFSVTILTCWLFVNTSYLYRLDALPISRKRVFAVFTIPPLLVLILGYGLGYVVGTVFDPACPRVDYQPSSCCHYIRVPREFWEISWDGDPHLPPDSATADESGNLPLFKGGKIAVYNPFQVSADSTPEEVAQVISRAIHTVYGRKIPWEEIGNRYLDTGKNEKVRLKKDGFTLTQDYPNLKIKGFGRVLPAVLLFVGFAWFLFAVFTYRGVYATKRAKQRKASIMLSVIFVLFLMMGIGGLAADNMDLTDLSVISSALGILIRQLCENLPGGALTLWILCTVLLAGGYRLVQTQFQRVEFPPPAQSMKS